MRYTFAVTTPVGAAIHELDLDTDAADNFANEIRLAQETCTWLRLYVGENDFMDYNMATALLVSLQPVKEPLAEAPPPDNIKKFDKSR